LFFQCGGVAYFQCFQRERQCAHRPKHSNECEVCRPVLRHAELDHLGYIHVRRLCECMCLRWVCILMHALLLGITCIDTCGWCVAMLYRCNRRCPGQLAYSLYCQLG
jgi:hypothetical protein